MSKLLGVAIIAVIVYFALTRGMPWLETAMDKGAGVPGAGGDSIACVSEAGAAADTVVEELLPAARPPVDAGVWGSALTRGARVLAAAENACACSTPACAKGQEAVQELRGLYDELDDMARGNPLGFGNPARRSERVYELLDQARDLVRSE